MERRAFIIWMFKSWEPWVCLLLMSPFSRAEQQKDYDSSWSKVHKDIRLPLELRIINEGLAHDESHWFLSNKHVLYKSTAVVDPISIEISNNDAIPEDYRVEGYDHIGDIDVMISSNEVVGGMEGGPEGLLAKWNATDLSLLTTAPTGMNGVPWVAIDYNNRNIYTADWNECCTLNIFNVDTLAFVNTYNMPEGAELPKEIQGGAFFQDDLYLATNSGDTVYKLELQNGAITPVVSDGYKHHDYEMEGITFWDLEKEGYGTMHIFGNFMSLREKAIHGYSYNSESNRE